MPIAASPSASTDGKQPRAGESPEEDTQQQSKELGPPKKVKTEGKEEEEEQQDQSNASPSNVNDSQSHDRQ